MRKLAIFKMTPSPQNKYLFPLNVIHKLALLRVLTIFFFIFRIIPLPYFFVAGRRREAVKLSFEYWSWVLIAGENVAPLTYTRTGGWWGQTFKGDRDVDRRGSQMPRWHLWTDGLISVKVTLTCNMWDVKHRCDMWHVKHTWNILQFISVTHGPQ